MSPGLLNRFLWYSGATFIGYVCVLHLGWAIMELLPDESGPTTPLSALSLVVGPGWPLALTFFVSATAAIIGMLSPQRLIGLVLMVPQQALLCIMAWGAFKSIRLGIYPDTTVKTSIFILKDQWPLLPMWLAYTASVLVFHNVFRREE